VWVLGEAAVASGDALQILAFASHTRHRVRVYHLLDWHEPWSHGKRRLEHLNPQGYTRIGPALRYATEQLAERAARSKQLILVGDCKPTDYDAYEGSRGLADVHRALEEARGRGIRTYGLAVDGVARERLPQMFGPGAWSLLKSPHDLVRAVAQLHQLQRT
jgi:nitric oxide reductase NorD protein